MIREPFLRTREGRISLLAMLVLDVFFVPVLLSYGLLPIRTGDAVFAATMLVAVNATGVGKGRRIAISIAFAAFAVQILRFVSNSSILAIVDAALSALAMATFAGLVLSDVFRYQRVPGLILDVILAYLLVGASFAFLYEMAGIVDPFALTLDGRPFTPTECIYFSITTMTSVGYGDAVPRTTVTRAMAMAEALTGQLYVAVLIARFVNLDVAHGKAER